MQKPVALAADHGGFALKEEVRRPLDEIGVPYQDFGTHSADSVDYPDYARAACKKITDGECEFGLLFCSTGVGISIAANKVPGIRCCCASETFSAKYTRLHNNANVLAMGGKIVGEGIAFEMVDIFLSTEFEGGRHQRRVDKITRIEENR